MQETFQNNWFVAFKRNKNLQEIIIGHTIKNGKVLKAHSKNRKGKCEPCNTSRPSLCCKQVINTSAIRSYQTQQLCTIFHKLNCKRKFIIYFVECPLCNVQYVGKAETAFNVSLNNCTKDVNNPKSILANLHFRKPGHSFDLHAKFPLIKLSNIHTTDKNTIKFWLRCCEDFWIQKLEMLTTKGLNQGLNIVYISINCISCLLFCISDCSLEMKCFFMWQRKTDVKFWSFLKFVYIHGQQIETIWKVLSPYSSFKL